MPSLLLSNPLGADDAQEIGLEPREFAVGEVITVSDYVFATLIRTGYGIPYGVAEDILLIGDGSPTEAIGVDGQWYLDRLNEVLWGPKVGGYWPSDPIRPDRGVQLLRLDALKHIIVTYSTGTVVDLGQVGFLPRGPWATGVAYAVDDLVASAGSLFRVITAHTPAAGATAPTATAHGPEYELWAARGEQGIQGPASDPATTTTLGTIQLAGDLGGTAAAPTVPRLAELADKANTADVIPLTQKGAAGGVATLDGGGLVSSAQLPPLAITNTFPIDTEAEMLALAAQVGDVAIRTDGTGTFILRVEPASTLANWSRLATAADVSSVDGRTGAVVLTDRYPLLGADGRVQESQLPLPVGQDAGYAVVPNNLDPALPFDVTIVSNWGITDAGDVYYDDAGAPEAEAGLLIPDPETGSMAVWRPGAPWNDYLTTRLLDRGFRRYWGELTAWPADARNGDTVYRTDLFCLMALTGGAWRQVTRAVCTASQRAAMTDAMGLHTGFVAHESDTGVTMHRVGTAWRVLDGGGDARYRIAEGTAQSIAAGATITAALTTSESTHADITAAADGRTFTLNRAGLWLLSGVARVVPGGDGTRVVTTLTNSAGDINYVQHGQVLGGNLIVETPLSTTRRFAVGDTVQLRVFASTASSLDTGTGQGHRTHLALAFLRS